MGRCFTRVLVMVGSIAITSVMLVPMASAAVADTSTADALLAAPVGVTDPAPGALTLDELRNGRPGDVVLATSSTTTGTIIELPGGASFDVSGVVEPWRAVISENGEAGFYFGPGLVASDDGVVPPALPEAIPCSGGARGAR